MTLLLSLLFMFAGTPADTTHFKLRDLPPQIQQMDTTYSVTPKIRVESDGVIIGNTKYFMRIMKTDPSIDPGMIRMIPDYWKFRKMPGMPQPFSLPHHRGPK